MAAILKSGLRRFACIATNASSIRLLLLACHWLREKGADIHSSTTYVNCTYVSPIRQSIDYLRSCFHILTEEEVGEEGEDKFIIENERSFRDFSPSLIRMQFIRKIPKVEIVMHSRKETISNYYNYEFLEFTQRPDLYPFLRFHKTIVHSLPKPYKTDCFDYSTIGFTSLFDCIAKCRKKGLKEELKLWPGNFLTEDRELNDRMVEMFAIFGKNQSLDTIVGENCRQFCDTKNECFIQYFALKNYSFPYNMESFQVFIFTSDIPNLTYNHSPKVIFEEFISFIGSIVSLWFGFSIVMLSNIISIAFKYSKILVEKHSKSETFVANINVKRNVHVLNNIYFQRVGQKPCISTTVSKCSRKNSRQINALSLKDYFKF